MQFASAGWVVALRSQKYQGMDKSHFDKLSVTQGDPFEKTRTALAGTDFSDVRYTPRTGSTNEDALRLLGQPENQGATVVTDFQNAGSGRKGRKWIAPPGSALLFTTILPTSLDASALWAVPFWCGLAISNALALHGVGTTLQWPNDVLLEGRKVAGILCVSRGAGARVWAACGVGINLTRTDDEPYRGIDPPPAFLDDVALTDRAELLATILGQFARSLGDLHDAQRIARQWQDAARLPGATYRLLVDGEARPFEAVAQRLGYGGALVVLHNGSEREISFADARVLR